MRNLVQGKLRIAPLRSSSKFLLSRLKIRTYRQNVVFLRRGSAVSKPIMTPVSHGSVIPISVNLVQLFYRIFSFCMRRTVCWSIPDNDCLADLNKKYSKAVRGVLKTAHAFGVAVSFLYGERQHSRCIRLPEFANRYFFSSSESCLKRFDPGLPGRRCPAAGNDKINKVAIDSGNRGHL